MRYPATAALALAAYEATGASTHPAFVALFDGAIGLRTFRGWLSGDRVASPLAEMVLREVAAGWLPGAAR